MESVSVRELKNNPSGALKHAREGEMVVVTNRDTSEVVLVGLLQLGMPDVGPLRLAIAASLFWRRRFFAGYFLGPKVVDAASHQACE